MNIKALLTTLLTVSVALAGCTSGEDATTDSGDTPLIEENQLGSQGGIRGLVVDDNYRPVQLKEEWDTPPGDFQDVGFVIILETAQRLETSENGEFVIAPLEPGTYTVRVAADDHEAIDKSVQVVAGEYSEVTVEARRQYSGGGTTLTQEYTMFDACSARLVAIGFSGLGCADNSGDGSRSAFTTDLSAFDEDIRAMVTEFRAHQDGWYRIQVRMFEPPSCDDFANGCQFWNGETRDGRYLRGVTYTGKNWQPGDTYLDPGQEGYCTPHGYDSGEDTGCTQDMAPDWSIEFTTVMFPEHPSRNLYYDTPVGFLFGAGVVLGTKAQFLQTVFLYDLPEEGIDDYCALCSDADTPE